MSTNTIITIERQYGSGGHLIGEKLAESLGIPFYDSELIKVAAKESGICEEIFESFDEKPTTSFLYSLVMDSYSMGYTSTGYSDMPINHKIFLAQFDTIKKLADEGSCVFIGRCADYALEEYDNCVNVFIHADLNARIRRVARLYDLTDAKAKDMILKTDKKRANYYNYYSNKKWSDVDSYDLCISSSDLGVDGAVEIIKSYIAAKEALTKAPQL